MSKSIQRSCAQKELKRSLGSGHHWLALSSLASLCCANSFAASRSIDYEIGQGSLTAGGGRSVSHIYIVDNAFGADGGIVRSGSGEIVLWTDQLGMLTPLNTAPVPRNLLFERHPGGGLRIAVSKIVQASYDPDGDTLELAAFDPVTSTGGAVQRNANWLIYEPVPGNNKSDFFAFSIADGEGAEAAGIVHIAVWQGTGAPTENVSRVVITGDQVIVKFVGIPGLEYRIESTPSLNNPQWQPIAISVAGVNGRFEIREVRPPESVRFYRALAIPGNKD